MKILLHSSKTMKSEWSLVHALTHPLFIRQAVYVNAVLHDLDVNQLARLMHINNQLAANVKQRIDEWNDFAEGSAAALTFRGDIYSGLSAVRWNKDDANFAQTHLLILSGLYGLLRPFDAIKPYRLEMGYKLQLPDGTNLDKYWENELAHSLDVDETYVNLTAKEYYKVIQKQLDTAHVITPKFLTMNDKKGEPVFVTVHAKIARGAFANWLIKNKINSPNDIPSFNELNYVYDKNLSTPTEPVFVCKTFGGLGLSVRLK